MKRIAVGITSFELSQRVSVYWIAVRCHNYSIFQHWNVKTTLKWNARIVSNRRMLVSNRIFSSLCRYFSLLEGDYQIRSAAHAYPCSYLPSCKNRPDGLYPDRLRDCRMYFRCTSERSSESYSCSQDTLPLGERFSFEDQRCLPAQHAQCTNDEAKPAI